MAAFDDDSYADALRTLPPGDLPARNDVIDLPGGARPVSVGRLLDKLRNRGRPAVNANLRDALERHGLFLEAHPTKDRWVRLPNIRPRHGTWTDDHFAKALEARDPGDLPGTDIRDPLPAGHDRESGSRSRLFPAAGTADSTASLVAAGLSSPAAERVRIH